jgi:branched-chain amino acid transport system substrate-binding protein
VKRLLIAAAALVAVAFGAGAQELKIAILAPLSGPVPTFGASTRDGALLAIDQWNARGGVLGRKIRALVQDSQCTRGPAVEAANRVIRQDHVHYIVGEVCSGASIPLSEIANKAKVIQISPTSTEPAVTVDPDGKTKAYVFRACFIDPFQGIFGASFAVKTLKARKAFIIFDPSNSYGRGLAEYFAISFRAQGGRIVGRETYAYTDVDFSAILSRVKEARPDVIYLPDSYGIANLVTRQAKQTGIKTPFLGGDGWDSPDLDTEAADGGYFTTHFSPDDPRPQVRSFLEAYGAVFKEGNGGPRVPDALAVLAYDAVNLLLQAIKEAGDDDTDKVRVVLEKMEFDAVSGRISFDAQHNPEKPAAVLAVMSGKVKFYALVTP